MCDRLEGTILNTNKQTNKQTTRWSVVLEKLTGPQLLKKSPEFYVTRGFITAFARARHLSVF